MKITKNELPQQYTKLLCVLLLSFSSGLPFLLILSTLHIWLKECGVCNTTIGIFALVTLPYSFKFLIAPILNMISPPFLYQKFGLYKGWILWSQLGLILTIILLALTSPKDHILQVGILTFFIALFSAVQDIYIEGYRIELLDPLITSLGASFSNTGYRIGMWVSGAGALYIATIYTWKITYLLMSSLITIGMITTILAPMLAKKLKNDQTISTTNKLSIQFLGTLLSKYYKAFKTHFSWTQVIIVIFGFKMVDTFLNVMAAPFMIDLGFSKIEIATAGKTFGIAAMIIGSLTGGILLRYFSLFKMFITFIVMQFFSALVCLLQYKIGIDIAFLYFSMGIEHFASGVAATVFITYLSLLSRHHHTAVLYAILTSNASLSRILFSSLAGITVDYTGWRNFFTIIMSMCIIYIVFILFIKYVLAHFNRKEFNL